MRSRRRPFAPAGCLLLLLLVPAPRARAENLLDHYRRIPDRLLDGTRYSLHRTRDRWMAQPHGEGSHPEALVDLGNGYLRIRDPGTGGGSLTQELALFRTAAGTHLVGVSLTRFDGVGSDCRLAFYDPADGQWSDLTSAVLPAVDLSLFLAENHDANRIEPGRGIRGVAILYSLPRTGTTLRAFIELDRLIVGSRTRSGAPSPGVVAIVNGFRYQEVQLLWDRSQARFRVGDRIPFRPSGLVKDYLSGADAPPSARPRQGVAAAPPADDPERLAIEAALRRERFQPSGLEVVFEVPYLKIESGWAWFHVRPRTRDGRSQLEDLTGLMQQTGVEWKVVELRSAEADDPESGDDALYFGNLKLRHPGLPPEILPRQRP